MEEWELNETIEEMDLDETRRVEARRVETRRRRKPPAGTHTAGTLLTRGYALPRAKVDFSAGVQTAERITTGAHRSWTPSWLHVRPGVLPGFTSGRFFGRRADGRLVGDELGTRHQVSGSCLIT